MEDAAAAGTEESADETAETTETTEEAVTEEGADTAFTKAQNLTNYIRKVSMSLTHTSGKL